MSEGMNRFWAAVTACLLVACLCGGAVLAVKLSKGRHTEITIQPPKSDIPGTRLQVSGAVTNGGTYSLQAEDTLGTVLLHAGLTPDADLDGVRLYVPKSGEGQGRQRVNINTAEVWLLQAVPEIGPGRAEAIVKYRTDKGLFARVEDLLKVDGIGRSTFEKMRDYITVAD